MAREKHTGFPVIPGSAVKGVLADGSGYLAERRSGTRTEIGRDLFGHEMPEDESATSGSLAFSEAKLFAFPVRSAKGCFAWVTSPLILQRWKRDVASILDVNMPNPEPKDLEIYGDASTLALSENQTDGQDETADPNQIVLEDYVFKHIGDFDDAANLAGLLTLEASPDGAAGDTAARQRDTLWGSLCAQHFCVISDDMMSHFARNACEIAPHVKIDDQAGTAADKALFNQENVPAETLFYAVISELRAGKLALLSVPAVLQIGGDATTGHGFCSTRLASQT